MAPIKEFCCRLCHVLIVCGVIPVTLAAQISVAASKTAPLDTLVVIAGPGVRGQVGAQSIRASDAGGDAVRTLIVVAARGSRVSYAVASDTGYGSPRVVFDDDSVDAAGIITVAGNHSLAIAAERAIGAGSPNKKLYELLREQLTAADPLAAYVDVECEIARLRRAFPDSGERLVDAAEQKAVDQTRDAAALRRIDAALKDRAFGGCVDDRRIYQKATQKKF